MREEEAELLGQLGVVEVAALAEGLEGVGIEDGGPGVAVVACRVSAAEDVLEVAALVAADDFGDEADFGHRLVFEVGQDDLGGLGDAVVVHIEQRGCQQLGVDESLAEGAGGFDFGYEAVGDGLAGLVVAGVFLHHLRVAAPVLHHLAGHLDEVAGHVGAAQRTVVALAQYAVQAVAELVEECLALVEVEQRGFVFGGLGEVADHRDDGDDVVAVFVNVLLAEVGHPGAAALAFAREEVHIKDGDNLVAVKHFVADGFGMVLGQLVVFAEGDAVELVGNGEGALAHLVEREVGTYLVVVQRIALLAHLLAVVAPVPRLQLGAGLVLLEHLLVLVALLFCLVQGRSPQVHQALVDSFGGLGQTIVERVGGVAFEAKNLGALKAQVDDAVDKDAVVIVAAGAADGVGLPHLLAQLAVGAVLHKRFPAGDVECEACCILETCLVSGLEGGSYLVVGEAYGMNLVGIEVEPEGIGGGKHVVAETQRQRGQQAVDFAEALLLVGRDVGAVADKVLVGLLDQTHLLAVQSEGFALLVDGLDALEEFGVEHNVVAVGGDEGCGLFGNLLHFGAVDALGQIEEDGADLVEQVAALFEGLDGVGERRRFGVVGNGVDFSLLLLDALFEGGHIMLGFDFFKIGDAVGRVPFPEERIVHIVLVFAGCHQCQCCAADDE